EDHGRVETPLLDARGAGRGVGVVGRDEVVVAIERRETLRTAGALASDHGRIAGNLRFDWVEPLPAPCEPRPSQLVVLYGEGRVSHAGVDVVTPRRAGLEQVGVA